MGCGGEPPAVVRGEPTGHHGFQAFMRLDTLLVTFRPAIMGTSSPGCGAVLRRLADLGGRPGPLGNGGQGPPLAESRCTTGFRLPDGASSKSSVTRTSMRKSSP